jgi:two-component system chemotaxis sensor kinase CheA
LNSKEAEYRDLFLTEALENFEALNNLFIKLEKEHGNKRAIAEIFRITHTLKGNAMGMGFKAIGELAHIMEDIMDAVKSSKIELNEGIIEQLFRANDKLGELIKAIGTEKKVSYIGLKTKLEVLLRSEMDLQTGNEAPAEEQQTKTEETSKTENPETVEEKKREELFEDPDQEEETEEGNSADQNNSDITFAEVIQIPVRKMDELMNLVGELLIERDRLITKHELQGGSRNEFEGLKRITSNLHYGIMNARMVQIGFLFNKFHRIARDAAFVEQKQVNLVLEGTEVEIDRNILKIMSDSLVHLVRNSIGHGIEKPADRVKAGKPEEGTVTLTAQLQKDNIRITIADDGKGIDAAVIKEKIVEKKLATKEAADKMTDVEIIDHIFMTGFSSAQQVTDISGRGVGMDVVKKAVESIGGQVMIDTQAGLGSQVHLTLPSSLAIKSALLFKLQDQEHAVPMSYTESVMDLYKRELKKIGKGLMGNYMSQTIPFVFLEDLFSQSWDTLLTDDKALHKAIDEKDDDELLHVIIVSYSGRLIGLIVDQLMQQKEIIEKAMPKPLDHIKMISGTTLLGNGRVCPVIDVASIFELLFRSGLSSSSLRTFTSKVDKSKAG